MTRRPLAIALAVLVLSAPAVRGQTCLGAASFAAGPIQLGLTTGFNAEGSSFGATVGIGAVKGPFGYVQAGQVTLDVEGGDDLNATEVGGTLGYAINVGPAERPASLQICPAFGVARLDGPDFDIPGGGRFSTTSVAFTGGVSIGGVVVASPSVSVVPSAGFSYSRSTLTATGPELVDHDVSDTYGILGGGLGLVFNRTVALGVSVHIPVGADDGETMFGFSFAFSVGPKRAE